MRKMKMTLMVMGLVCVSLGMSQAFAETSPGGSDACGLGWSFTKSKTLSGTSTRGTTNGFIPPTFGMTSGTIGCDSHPIAAEDVPAASYAITNFDSLKHQIARGRGEVLDGLAYMMGCPQGGEFNVILKGQYAHIFNGERVTPLQAFQNIKHLAKNRCSTKAL
ncbi:MAG: DUF3015 family protein [Bacteriovoracales bacterium]|nr:DUF3015 family protein [Bacteriovoracales bacterium]